MYKVDDRPQAASNYQYLQFLVRFYSDKSLPFLERNDDVPVFRHIDHRPFVRGAGV
jgi:hypothetical protein